jgi:4-carboxymuconolactone decarboxylase
MARIDPIPRDDMTPEQLRVNDLISATRGGGQASGPFGLWLRTPELAEKATIFGSHLRSETSLSQRLTELAVLTIARAWTAQYEWFAHERYVEQVGLDPAIVDAIKNRADPAIEKEDEKIVYRVTSELMDERKLSDETYAEAVRVLGEQTTLDLVTIIGFYTMVAIVLVACQVDIPNGGENPLAE